MKLIRELIIGSLVVIAAAILFGAAVLAMNSEMSHREPPPNVDVSIEK